MAIKSVEEKMILDPYVSITTISKYFSQSKFDAEDIFIKAQELDFKDGYYTLYKDKVRSEAVLKLLGLDPLIAIARYKAKRRISHE